MTDRLLITYDGPALAAGEMDVSILAPAILSFGELFTAANDVLNGDRAKVVVTVRGDFKSGSFGIDFNLAQSLMQQATNFLTGDGVESILNIRGLLGLGFGAVGVVQAKRALKGRKPESSEDAGGGLRKLSAGENSIIVHPNVEALLADQATNKAFEGAVCKPLSSTGIDRMLAGVAKNDAVEILSGERSYFKAMPMEDEEVSSVTSAMRLQIVAISFHNDHQWKFSDGGPPFWAPVTDDAFMEQVRHHHVTFGDGDYLMARVKRTQYQRPDGTLRVDNEVVEVLKHGHGNSGLTLPMPLGDDGAR